jgi:hypothetical protein
MWTAAGMERNAVGVELLSTAFTQGSSCLATQGFVAKSLWDFFAAPALCWTPAVNTKISAPIRKARANISSREKALKAKDK